TTIRKKEKQISRQRRITAVRMVMEGYTMVDVAAILGMHRQSVASYVKKFKEHALEGLLTRKQIPGKKPVFNASTTGRIEATYFTYNSS
ncbi:helix-turn-helix domain-containing protein, partial [Escherichia sp. HC-CC4]